MMKKALVFLFLLLGFTAVQARQWGVEVGVNYPVPLRDYAEEGNRLGFYVQGVYFLPHSGWALNAKLSHEVYPSTEKDLDFLLANGQTLRYPANMGGHANALQLGAAYYFLKGERFSPYLGGFVGVSSDQLRYQENRTPEETHLIVGPQLGVLLFEHLNVSFQTSLTKSDYVRMMLNVGYRF